jgi:hypothetical protein
LEPNRHEVEIAMEDYCFCACHTEALETPINTVLIPLGVLKLDPGERVAACAECHPAHVDAETEQGWVSDEDGWQK